MTRTGSAEGRSALRSLVFAVAAAATSSAAPDAGSAVEHVLDGCRQSPVSGGTQFQCAGVLGAISEFPDATVQAVLSAQVAGLRAAIKGELITSEASYSAAGKTWPGIVFSVRQAGDAGDAKVLFEGRILAFESRKGVARTVLCGGPTSNPTRVEDCNKILPVLAEAGPAALAKRVEDPIFLGKKLDVPAGCQTLDSNPKAFRIGCGETAFIMSMVLDSPTEIAKVTAFVQEQMLKAVPGAVEAKDRPCKVGGVTTVCKVIAVGDGEDRGVFYTGGAVVDKTPVVATCGQPGDLEGVHPVCAAVLAF